MNEAGGINGRKINFITLDDGYNPAKTVECIRQLVEQDKVLCTFNTLGTPTNTAIHKYMNQKKVPSCSSPPAPRSGVIPSTSRGRWASSPTITPRR